jgi:hypothetical protein
MGFDASAGASHLPKRQIAGDQQVAVPVAPGEDLKEPGPAERQGL